MVPSQPQVPPQQKGPNHRLIEWRESCRSLMSAWSCSLSLCWALESGLSCAWSWTGTSTVVPMVGTRGNGRHSDEVQLKGVGMFRDKPWLSKKVRKKVRKKPAKTTRKHDKDPPRRSRPVSMNWKTKYGLTADQGFDLLKRQGNKCKICSRALWIPKHGEKKPPRENTPCVDHKHGTPIIRGFLCSTCNTGLGMFQDNPELMEKAAEYLRADPPHIKHDLRGLSQIAPLRLSEPEDPVEENKELAS